MMEMAKKACPDVPASGQAVREDALQGNASRRRRRSRFDCNS